MRRQWWFFSAKRDGFSLSGAGGACGFLCICALNGAEFLKLAVHKCFCFSLTSIFLRLLFRCLFPLDERWKERYAKVMRLFYIFVFSWLLARFGCLMGALSLELLEVSHLCYKAQKLYLIVTVSPLSQNRWGNSDAVNVSSEKTCCLLK